MSPPWAVTSSLFCVVWACAAPGSACGSAPPTPSAAAPLSSSRRVTSMGCTSTRWLEESADRTTVVDAGDGLGEQGRHGEDLDLRGGRGDRDGIGHEEPLEAGGAEPLQGAPGEHRVDHGRRDVARSLIEEEVGGAEDRPPGRDLVVDEQAA